MIRVIHRAGQEVVEHVARFIETDAVRREVGDRLFGIPFENPGPLNRLGSAYAGRVTMSSRTPALASISTSASIVKRSIRPLITSETRGCDTPKSRAAFA